MKSEKNLREQGIEGLGMGVKRYSGESTGDTSAFSEKYLKAKNYQSFSDFMRKGVLITSRSHLHESVKKTSGLKINFGFFSFGHKSETLHETTFDELTVNFLVRARRWGNRLHLAVSDDALEYSSRAQKLIDENKAEEFYHYFGSNYISKVETGYYFNLLLSLSCSSQEEAESKKRELEAAYNSDEGSGEAKFGSDKGLESFVKENNVVFSVEHNLPALDWLDTSTIKGCILALSKIEQLKTDEAPPMGFHISEYSLYEFFTKVLEPVDLILEDRRIAECVRKCDTQLGRIRQYGIDEGDEHNNSSKDGTYEEIENIRELKDGYEEVWRGLEELTSHTNRNPFWAKSEALREKMEAILSECEALETVNLKYLPHIDIGFEVFEDSIYADHLLSGEQEMLKFINQKCPECNVIKVVAADKMHGYAQGVVFYNKKHIPVPDTQPNKNTKWVSTELKTEIKKDDKNKDYVKKLSAEIARELNKLGPAELFYSQVIFTNAHYEKQRKKKTHMVIYYPKLN